MHIFNHTVSDFCHLQKAWIEIRPNVGTGQAGSKLLDTLHDRVPERSFVKANFVKKVRCQQKHEKYRACKELMVSFIKTQLSL